MKKVTRLLRPKSKKSKDAQYNALSGGNGGGSSGTTTSTAEPIPAIHNYGQSATKNKLKSTKTQPTKGKLHSTRKKIRWASSKEAPVSQRITASTDRTSESSITDNNNFNYSSLNRNRSSYSNSSCGSIPIRDAVATAGGVTSTTSQQIQKRSSHRSKRWWRRLLCCIPCACACARKKQTYQPHRRYKDYWQQSVESKPRRRWCSCLNRWRGCGCGRGRASSGKRWLRRCCCCCCGRHKSSYQYDSEEDEDIDGKFASYIYEMQQRESNAATITSIAVTEAVSVATTQLQSTLIKFDTTTNLNTSQTLTNEAAFQCGSEAVVSSCGASVPTAFPYRRRSSNGGRVKPKPRAWTWDDSLRSNSDRFLETLEEDELNTASVCSFVARRPPLPPTTETHTRRGEEAKAAAEELSQSPVIGKRNDPAASPIQSRGSATSETWPTQSDEDIDRLVAMHQNRDSLSSLGLRSDSMASVYSGAGEGRYGTVVVKGQVEFGIQYNYKLGALEIHVVRCKDLAAVDVKRNRSDPYVKVYLLPDKSKAGKRKTKVKKHTLNPILDEILRFHMPISSLESRTLWLTVWHSDMFGRNDFLGEVSVSLQGKVFDNPQSQWYLLQERSEPFDEVATYRGDIVVGLKYIPPENVRPGFLRSASTSSGSSNLRKFGSIKSVTSRSDRSAKGGQLHVLVKEAKHLSPIKVNGTCDAFCKSYLLPDRTRSSKQKTPVVKRSLHPTWNYTFIYEDVSLDDLSERALELTVWDHDRLASNEFLGGVRFSLGTGKSYGRSAEWMDATGKELSLWQNMIDRPNFWVEGSLILRSTLDGIRAIP